ncbi:hypothetical protein MGYG_03405 [Nannizzia gypsea CBS 118893]|uniref:Uncharacterized protein n=1 Tax=Arthroderma gypseum (strain ATCC MYA-4604 / CBS 118893) TaxID=535722 RepID=E4UNF1_ARTGP|nr:hypothetical protein MGYG_03405 [Nannizzia gypsea CBS 118893]EFR00401.1 hypothetical protein MGYG_03405 [Nannizzia gypsea CBS 118893]
MPNTVVSSMAPAGHNDKLGLSRATLAPSPTLTNPDMILPYGDRRESSTPSPALEDLQRAAEHSRLLANSYSLMHQRNTSISTTTSYDRSSSGHDDSIHHYTADSSAEGSPRVTVGAGAGASPGAGTGTGNSGLMRSSHMADIDHSTRTHSRRQSRASTNSLDGFADAAGSSSSGLGANNGLSKRHSKLRELQDLPDGFFEQDNKAHTDDDTTADDLSAVVFEPEHRMLPMGAIAEEDEDGEEKTETEKERDTADKSDRVYDELEELTSMLENAKLKLTHMEGNLSRARSSFRMTPSPSPSLNRSFGSVGNSYYKPLAKGERRSQTSLAGALLRQRAHQGFAGNGSHLRGQSDLGSPSQSSYNRLSGMNGQFRSYSALGSTSASEYKNGFFSHAEEEEEEEEEEEQDNGTKQQTTETNALDPEATTDGSISRTPSSQSASIPNAQSRTSPLPNGDIKSSPSSLKSPLLINKSDSSSQSTTPPSPASAQLQMRGLQGQVDGLRSKLSSLKERTQEESIRRRSQQSLRTPSPFTVADESYTNPLELRRSSYPDTLSTPNYNKTQSPPPPPPAAAYKEENQDTTCKPSPTRSDEQDKPKALDVEDKEIAIEPVQKLASNPLQDTTESPIEGPVEEPEPVEEPVDGPIQGPAQAPVDNTARGVAEETDESESEYFDYSDYESESSEIDRQELEEILREPLSSPPESVYQDILEEFPSVPAGQETIRHEDRIDAFDYEHFILHSALGTYSNRLTRSGSFCSVGSTETTRPDGRETPKNRSALSRVTSSDSISTEATFATANEGDYGYDDALASPNGHGPYPKRLSPQYTGDSLTIPTRHFTDSTSTLPSTQSASSTPRASIASVAASHEENAALLASISELKRAAAAPQTPDLLVRSILSSAASAKASDESAIYSPQTGSLCDADAQLVEAVVQSLGNVSLELLRASTADLQSPIDNRIVTILRRRLDAARRILDGVAPLEANP